MQNTRTCTHIKVNGVRCGSPALRGEDYCYFHYRMLCTSRLSPIALLENEEAIQVSIMQIVDNLLHGTIELKRGELILRALNTAVRNIRRAQFEPFDMVRTLPKDPVVPPRPHIPSKEEIEAFKKECLAGYDKSKLDEGMRGGGHPDHPENPAILHPSQNSGVAHPKPALSEVEGRSSSGREPARVGTGAPARPSGPDLPVRSVDPTPRKPPVGVKEIPAAQQRKIRAHSLP